MFTSSNASSTTLNIAHHFTSPHDIPLAWLVAFMLRRHPVPHPNEPTWVQTLYSALRPLYTWTPDDVQAKVRCHSPTKSAGHVFRVGRRRCCCGCALDPPPAAELWFTRGRVFLCCCSWCLPHCLPFPFFLLPGLSFHLFCLEAWATTLILQSLSSVSRTCSR